jgi:hypothetical protein
MRAACRSVIGGDIGQRLSDPPISGLTEFGRPVMPERLPLLAEALARHLADAG